MKSIIDGRFIQIHINRDTCGRIFFITDPHGQFDMVVEALDLLEFNDFTYADNNKDILISLGDNCDRGSGSFDLLSMFRHSENKQSLMGNHEKMMFDGTRAYPFVKIGRAHV